MISEKPTCAHQVKWAIVTSGPIVIFNKMLPMFSYGPIIFQQLLLMSSDGPIAVVTVAADDFGWAHCSCNRCCQWFYMGPLFFWQLILISLYGPIAVATAIADNFVWAHYFFGSFF